MCAGWLEPFDDQLWPLECLVSEDTLLHDPQDKVDNDGGEEGKTQNGRPESIVVRPASTLPDRIRAPVVGDEGVEHDGHGDQCKHPRRDLADLVAKVEESDGEAGEDDGEVEP